jgi:hypothetical protein
MSRIAPIELVVQAEQQRKAAEARASLAQLRLAIPADLSAAEAAALQAAFQRFLATD